MTSSVDSKKYREIIDEGRSAERRKSRRVPFETKIKYGFPDPKFEGITYNLSRAGIAAKVPIAYPPCSDVSFLLYVGDQVVRADGTVAWMKEDPDGTAFRIGIRFTSRVDLIESIYNQAVELIDSELEDAGIPV